METAALDAWHNGNPLPISNFIRKDFTYFDPAMNGGLMAGTRLKNCMKVCGER